MSSGQSARAGGNTQGVRQTGNEEVDFIVTGVEEQPRFDLLRFGRRAEVHLALAVCIGARRARRGSLGYTAATHETKVLRGSRDGV